MRRDTDEIEELVRSWEACTLPRKEWVHAAHLTVALWHLLRYPYAEAVERVRVGIRRYNDAHGVPVTPRGGYHETVTLFWMRIVQDYLSRADRALSPADLTKKLLEERGDKRLPFEYYTQERFFSPEARFSWVEPDRKPLPAPRLAPPPPRSTCL